MPHAEYYAANRERLLANQKKYYQAHKEERDAYTRRWCEEHKEQLLEYKKIHGKQHRDSFREKLFTCLGSVCVNCGFTDKRALQFDHINGGGTEHRRNFTGTTYYQSIIDDPEIKTKYQTLCANCNTIKKLENDEYKRKAST